MLYSLRSLSRSKQKSKFLDLSTCTVNKRRYSANSSKNNRVFALKGTLQFSSIAQSCLTLCNLMDCSTPGFPVHHQFLELAHTHVHRVSDGIQLSPALFIPFSSCHQSFQASGSFPMSQFFASGDQSIGVSASASVLPMNIQN